MHLTLYGEPRTKKNSAHDGSRVDYDKARPRAEIWIEEMEDEP